MASPGFFLAIERGLRAFQLHIAPLRSAPIAMVLAVVLMQLLVERDPILSIGNIHPPIILIRAPLDRIKLMCRVLIVVIFLLIFIIIQVNISCCARRTRPKTTSGALRSASFPFSKTSSCDRRLSSLSFPTCKQHSKRGSKLVALWSAPGPSRSTYRLSHHSADVSGPAPS